jgi:hypothetical protein
LPVWARTLGKIARYPIDKASERLRNRSRALSLMSAFRVNSGTAHRDHGAVARAATERRYFPYGSFTGTWGELLTTRGLPSG